MKAYQEYEEDLFTWLMSKHKNDPEFTFSVRKKASKGAQGDYFIGTENSNYFGTTFWHIPVAYPGASTDPIDLMIEKTPKGISYYFQLFHTRNPSSTQDKLVLTFIQELKEILKGRFSFFKEGGKKGKMESYYVRNGKDTYENIEDIFSEFEKEIPVFLDVVGKHLMTFQAKHPELKAERISKANFNSMIEALEKRRANYNTPLSVPLQNSDERLEDITIQQPSSNALGLNCILYGPPGTGKTFTLKNEYFGFYTTTETSISIDQHFNNVAADLSWWQAIALALIELKKAKVGDIKKNRWVKSKIENSNSNSVNAAIWGSLQSHTREDSETVKYKQRTAPFIFDKLEHSQWFIIKDSIRDQAPELLEILDSVNNFTPNPDNTIERYVFTTFHQSFAYEDFIEGIKPVITNGNEASELAYEIVPGIFKKLCERAAKDLDNRYAIFIDEINRGNVANIFGELITLIELDKRAGCSNAMSVQLPYSKTRFSVPPNVDIIGTMNTADRSVEALDTALRRRFSFKEMKPDPDKIDEVLGEGARWDEISLSDVLRAINARIETLIDRDHAIGHSYFLELKDAPHIEGALKTVFFNKIIPLLQEYFYNDYSKIGMVLGKGFVQIERDEVRFADFESDQAGDYSNGGRISLIPADKVDLKNALYALLNKKDTGQDNG
jgi:5-methylcytosine-specific restriction protein B